MANFKTLVTAVILATYFTAGVLESFLPSTAQLVASLALVPCYLLLLRWVNGPAFLVLRFDRNLAKSVLLGGVFLAVLYEPQFVVRFQYVTPTPVALAISWGNAIVFGAFLQAFLFTGVAQSRIRQSKAAPMGLPYAFYVVLLFPLSTILSLFQLAPQDLFQFAIGGFFVPSTLFVFLYLLYVKTRFDNLSGIAFYALYSLPAPFGIVLAANQLLALSWIFVSFGVSFILLELLFSHPPVERRLFPVPRARHRRIRLRSVAELVAVPVAVLLVLFVVLPAASGTAQPLYADPTGSMAPTIQPGSLLWVTHVNPSDVRLGQILVFDAPWAPGLTVAHQVVGILVTAQGLAFQTRGIANPANDSLPVPASDVIGIVSLVIPYLGLIVIDYYLVVLAVAFVVGAYILYSLSRTSSPRYRRRYARRR